MERISWPLVATLWADREGARCRLRAGDVKGFNVPNSCALLGGLAEEEANLLEGLGEGEFGGHFWGREGERKRKRRRSNWEGLKWNVWKLAPFTALVYGIEITHLSLFWVELGLCARA